MSTIDIKAGEQQLAELAAVLKSPEAQDLVGNKNAKGNAMGRRRLGDARRWIDEMAGRLKDAIGNPLSLTPVISEIGRVHAFVMFVGDQREISLAGDGPGIAAWRVIKQHSHSYRHLTGPNWHQESGPYWPRWTIAGEDNDNPLA